MALNPINFLETQYDKSDSLFMVNSDSLLEYHYEKKSLRAFDINNNRRGLPVCICAMLVGSDSSRRRFTE